jgi:hypothetical protein
MAQLTFKEAVGKHDGLEHMNPISGKCGYATETRVTHVFLGLIPGLIP